MPKKHQIQSYCSTLNIFAIAHSNKCEQMNVNVKQFVSEGNTMFSVLAVDKSFKVGWLSKDVRQDNVERREVVKDGC